MCICVFVCADVRIECKSTLTTKIIFSVMKGRRNIVKRIINRLHQGKSSTIIMSIQMRHVEKMYRIQLGTTISESFVVISTDINLKVLGIIVLD